MADTEKKKKGRKPQVEADLFPEPVYTTSLKYSYGFESSKLWNLHFIDPTTLLTAAGNTIQFLNTNTKEMEVIAGRDGGGIGATCVHPSHQYFVVAEKGHMPNVYVYTYPGKEIYKVMKGGTEREFSACAFNTAGDKLATCGADPDFMLTVWNWQEQHIILRSKAFGTRVLRVTFMRTDDGQLTSCGLGHIKFWKMARTFTGLKLQGAIGKFGRIEISDIAGYAELPDRKVLSGSETGSLLLWENNLIKVEIHRSEGVRCHAGAIEIVHLADDGSCFITAGHDGWIRWWDFEKVDQADTFDDQPVFFLEPDFELKVADGCVIRGIARGPETWMIQDGRGAFWSLPAIDYERDILGGRDLSGVEGTLFKSFHADRISCLGTSPFTHSVVTAGDDGTVRLFDYMDKKEVYQCRFNAGATCMQWLSLSQDPSGLTIALGFQNGVFRVLQLTEDGFALTAVMKPHTTAISAFVYSPDGKNLITASVGGTLFFFHVEDPVTKYLPIGFSNTPAPPTCLAWNHYLDKAIMGSESGDVFLVQFPEDGVVDQAVSFEFQAQFQKLAYNQVMKPKPKDSPPSKKKSNEEEEEEEHKPEEEGEYDSDGEEEHDKGPWAVNFIIVTPAGSLGKLIIGLQHPESVFLYDGDAWESANLEQELEPEDPLRNLAFYDTVAVTARPSWGGSYLLLGCEKGRVLMRMQDDLEKVSHSTLVHDGMYGTVLAAAMSFDECFLLSAGADGCFFVQTIEGAKPKVLEKPLGLSSQKVPAVEDIVNPDAYSIQEAKLKADEDLKRELAEKKKKSLREEVQSLMEEYEAIITENAAAESSKQVSKQELSLDPDIQAILARQNAERVEIAQKELAFITAKKELRLSKLRSTFIDSLQVERIVLNSFQSGRSVSSFRTPQLTKRQQENIAAVHATIQAEEAKWKEQQQQQQQMQQQQMRPSGSPLESKSPRNLDFERTGEREFENRDAPGSPVYSDHSGPEATGTSQDSPTRKSKRQQKPPMKSAVDKAEERKREREERDAGLRALKQRMPNEHTEDPRDMAAIARAEKFMGDYKLKTDPDYVVPETQRVTAERKFRQLVLLEESINTLRMDFNDRFLALRDLKLRLIENIKRDTARIQEINIQLNVKEDMTVPSMQPEEQPETRMSVDMDTLRQFEREQIKAAKRAAAMEKAKAGFGADLVGDDNEKGDDDEEPSEETDKRKEKEEKKKDEKKEDKKTEEKPVMKGGPKGRGVGREAVQLTGKQRMEQERKERLKRIVRSALEQEEEQATTRRLTYEKSRLQRKIEKTVATFDEAVDELRREKFKLEGDLKMADMKLLLLYKELMLLKDFKKQDQQLTKRLEDRRAEKADIMGKIQQCQERLGEKKIEIERLLAREKQIMADFNGILATSTIQETLVRIFKKKIKRKKVTNNDNDDDSDDSDDLSDDDSDDEGDDEEEVCPPGCDQITYQKVLELRERRMDQEEIVADFQKSIEVLRKENDQLSKKEKMIDTQLRQVEKEIQQFQNEKQKKLNELEAVVVLKIKQLQCLKGIDGNRMPRSLRDLVVFTTQGLNALRGRILELAHEKKMLNRDFAELRKKHIQLVKTRKDKQAEVQNWESKIYEIQLLKFGQRINLESLENVSVDRKTEELKAQLRREEMRWELEVKKWDQQLEEAKQRQSDITKANSSLLRRLGALRQEQQRLEETLNTSQAKILSRMAGGSKVAVVQDRRQLKEQIISQQQDIDHLKAEIALLTRKGGHVYTPVVNKTI